MGNTINLDHYRKAIQLDDSLHIERDEEWQTLITPVLNALNVSLPPDTSTTDALRALHALLATVDPNTLSSDLVDAIERVALGKNLSRPLVEAVQLPTIDEQFHTQYSASTQTSIWVGDITQLRVDSIVNAANSYLLGCRLPNHPCIDNAIHSAAGPRLRDDCAKIIDLQNSLEPTGLAKVTRGYALPAGFVIHTVGPQLILGSNPTENQRQQLENSYIACLELGAQIKSIRSIAFCAISTGVFGYPKPEAATVALSSTAKWLKSNNNRFDRVIFNLFSSADAAVYENLLRDW